MFKGPYSASGAIKVTAADSTYFGVYMPDGSLRIHSEAIGSGSARIYSVSGGIRYTLSSGNIGLYAPDGSIYVVDGDSDGGFGVYNANGNLRVSGLVVSSPTTVVQSNKAAAQGANTVTSLGSATTAGNLLVVYALSSGTITTPAGWTLSTGASIVSNQAAYIFWKVAAGADTMPTLTQGGNFTINWHAAEFSNMSGTPFDVAGNTGPVGSVTVATTSSITPATGRKLIVAGVGGGDSTLTDDNTAAWTGVTNSFSLITSTGFPGDRVTGTGVDNLTSAFLWKLVTGDGVTTASTAATVPSTHAIAAQANVIASFISTGT